MAQHVGLVQSRQAIAVPGSTPAAAASETMNTPPAPLTAAVRRLMKDMALMQCEPLVGVNAVPLENNIFEWHGNIVASEGPYRSHVFHLILTFPSDYPHNPPTIRLPVTFPHPNIFSSNYICLDLLQSYYTAERYAGWSSAYTVQTVLLQLQSFFFSENVPQHYGSVKNRQGVNQSVLDGLKAYTCSCSHTSSAPYPSVRSSKSRRRSAGAALRGSAVEGQPQTQETIVEGVIERSQADGRCHLTSISDNLKIFLYSFLDLDSIRAMEKTSKPLRSVSFKFYLKEQREILCFHSKVGPQEDVLGYGLTVSYYRDNSVINDIDSPLDLMSASTFYKESVRLGVWKDPFTHFLPIAIHQNHFTKSFERIKSCLNQLSRRSVFEPYVALDVLTRLMNRMVVSLMNCQQNGSHKYASEKALLGFCSFHHLLLAMTRSYPDIHKIANKKIASFIEHESNRSKKVIPDLGAFLLWVSVSKYQWSDISYIFIREMFVRGVRWLLRDHPELQKKTQPQKHRLTVTFEACRTSLRLVMFQVCFLNNIAQPVGRSIDDVLGAYNRSYGLPPRGTEEKLQASCKAILKVSYWPEFFDRVKVDRPSPEQLNKLLIDSIDISRDRKYH
eukprot:GILK01002283.1.p1 GENE.GILK01002283.1~~GILK01002283.1.p1  ORF type:complete len:627 (-),score=85.60 GILK01002283.1:164-2008(-)